MNRRRARKRKFIVSVMLLAVIAGSVTWLIFFSGYFHINEITISGYKAINPEIIRPAILNKLAERHWGVFPRSHVFFYRTAKIPESLQEKFVKISETELAFDLRQRRLNVKITERKPEGVLCPAREMLAPNETSDTASKCVLFSADGIAIETVDKKEINSVKLAVEHYSAAAITLGTEIISPEWVLFMKEFSAALEPKAPVRFYAIESESLIIGYVRAHTIAGWDILLNVKPEQARNYAAITKQLLEKSIGRDLARLKYIDLRVSGRAYYKLR